jgi:hypothetical protein
MIRIFVRSSSTKNGGIYYGFSSSSTKRQSGRNEDVLMSTITARLARTPSILDDGQIRPTLADDLQGE